MMVPRGILCRRRKLLKTSCFAALNSSCSFSFSLESAVSRLFAPKGVLWTLSHPPILSRRKCLPCEGGVEPCPLDLAVSQLEQLSGWRLTHDGQRIRKDWKVKNFLAGMDFFNRCAQVAEDDGHHPDLHIEGYRNCVGRIVDPCHRRAQRKRLYLGRQDRPVADRFTDLSAMVLHKSFPALVVRRGDDDKVVCGVETLSKDDLPAGDVLIEVDCSSLNYKDALATTAHAGVVRRLPHVPGIDCAGHVAESNSPAFSAGDPVLVTGYDLGAPSWGGYSAFVRVPADWVVAMPTGLTPREAMIYGTAGFTAAQCVGAIQHHGIQPEKGEVVVTGATGGVGCIAVALLAKLDYSVVAVTGKPEQGKLLEQLGAQRIISREDVDDHSKKPLLPARWSAAVDTVGGNALATLLRSIDHRGCVAACGLVASDQLPTTVYPFILRGVTLAGIDSAKCPREPRLEIWKKLATEWNVIERLEPLVREVTLGDLLGEVKRMLAGQNHGRILVLPQ